MRIPLGLMQQIATSVSRSFRKAFQEEILAARKDPKKWETVTATNFGNMDLNEAKQILDIEDITDTELLGERTDLLIKMNDKKQSENKGIGSTYTQSKILNAMERIEYESR